MIEMSSYRVVCENVSRNIEAPHTTQGDLEVQSGLFMKLERSIG